MPSEEEADSGHESDANEQPDVALLRVVKVNVSTSLTYHTSAPGSKPKSKKEKKVKTKELGYTFVASDANYITFLNTILAKHGEAKYVFTSTRRYTLKVLVPPNRA